MPLVTFYLDYRALGFAAEQADKFEFENAEAYLADLLGAAIEKEISLEADTEPSRVQPPLQVICPRQLEGDDIDDGIPF